MRVFIGGEVEDSIGVPDLTILSSGSCRRQHKSGLLIGRWSVGAWGQQRSERD